MKNYALIFNYDKYYNDRIFSTSNYVDHHFCEFFKILKDKIELNGDQLHTLDKYKESEDLSAIIVVDYPHFPRFSRFIKRFQIYLNNLKIINKNGNLKKYLYIWESPIYSKKNWDKNIYRHFNNVFGYGYCEYPGYIHFPYSISVNNNLETVSASEFQSFDISNLPDKKLCCMISGNKSTRAKHSGYKLRQSIIQFYETNDRESFDLFGFGYDTKLNFKNYLKSIYYNNPYAYKNPLVFRGEIQNKYDVMNNYKFVFAIENQLNCPGYVTEKLFDVLMSQAVPIYNGENAVHENIPHDVYIDINKFSNLAELNNYLKSISHEEYERYQKAKYEFLKSDAFSSYLHKSNVELMLKELYK